MLTNGRQGRHEARIGCIIGLFIAYERPPCTGNNSSYTAVKERYSRVSADTHRPLTICQCMSACLSYCACRCTREYVCGSRRRFH